MRYPVNASLCFVALILFAGCGSSFDASLTKFPGGISIPGTSSGNDSGNSSGTGIQVLSTASFSLTASDSPGNIAYDGTRLLVPIKYNYNFSGDQVQYDYFSTDLAYHVSSNSTYGGIQNFHYLFPSLAGQSALFWSTTSSNTIGKLSVRDNSSGSLQATIDIDLSNYGCNSSGSDGNPITYCGGSYYGVCTTSSGYMRFFSFNTGATMQSAVTTTIHNNSYSSLRALTCYQGNYLLLVTGYSNSNAHNGFYKYDLSFQQVATDSNNSYSFPSGLQSIQGISTDGSYLYLQGRKDDTKTPVTFMLGKATLGELK